MQEPPTFLYTVRLKLKQWFPVKFIRNQSLQGGAPQTISWFIFTNPIKYRYINHKLSHSIHLVN